jgi:hypothetical protein
MKIVRFTIPLYEYDVVYVEIDENDPIDRQIAFVTEELTNMKTDKQYLDETIQEIKEEYKNGGNHFYNLSKSVSFIMIYPHDNPERMKATIAHEKRHMEDRILKHYRVKDIESAGLLSGYLARFIP